MGGVIGEVCNNEDADTFAAQWEDFVNDAGFCKWGWIDHTGIGVGQNSAAESASSGLEDSSGELNEVFSHSSHHGWMEIERCV